MKNIVGCFKDYKTMISALVTGEVFQLIPKDAVNALYKEQDVIQKVSLSDMEFSNYIGVPEWESHFVVFGAKV